MDWTEELNTAVELAKEAGYLLLKQLNNKDVLSDEQKDIKLQADKNSEQLIVNRLRIKFPYAILSEESGINRVIKDGEPYWIIDPLDGTFNYLNDIPLCAISIALWKDNNPIFGVINLFKQNELIYGIVDKGIYVNEELIVLNKKEKSIFQSVLVTGYPLNFKLNDNNLLKFLKFSRNFKKVRMLGSATTSLAYVALGRAQVYWEEEIMLWDIAAGIALVYAVGGDVKVEKGKSSQWACNIIAINNCNREELNKI